MDLTFNPKVDIADTTPLMLGGVELRVAPLVFRQTVRIGPMLPDVLAILNKRTATIGGLKAAMASDAEAEAAFRALALSEAESRTLLVIVHIGLTRVYPNLALDDLYELPVSADELFAATMAVLTASGAIEKKAASTGEAAAASL